MGSPTPVERDGVEERGMPGSSALRIGTRASVLARTQTGHVADALRSLGHAVTIEAISTRGDVATDVPIAGIGGGDGVFVRELERALLDGRIDAAVHSLKDLPTVVPDGLVLASVPRRATPFDAFVGRSAPTLAGLPAGAVVGTSSVRRVMQLAVLRPDVAVRALRGNVDSRLARLDSGAFDGVILAAAGLERLGLAGRISEVLRPERFWPAIGQGALVIQTRADDAVSRAVVATLDDPPTHAAVRAERACLAGLSGGCLAPVGAWAREVDGRPSLGACVLGPRGEGVERIVTSVSAAAGEPPEEVGGRAAAALLALGAEELLAAARARDRRGLH